MVAVRLHPSMLALLEDLLMHELHQVGLDTSFSHARPALLCLFVCLSVCLYVRLHVRLLVCVHLGYHNLTPTLHFTQS